MHGRWAMPKEGDSLPTARGTQAKWRHVTAGKDGSFGGLGNGYFAASVDLPADRVFDLEAAGDSLVYVNGVPRAGDPYSNGYLKLPVALHAGQNTLVFSVGRGSLKAKLSTPRAPIQIETGDLTLPDVLVGGPTELWAGVGCMLQQHRQGPKVKVFARNSGGSASDG